MTQVVVDETKNTIVVQETDAVVVTAITAGPQGPPGVAGAAGVAGPAGPQGPAGIGSVSNIGDLADVNTTGKAANSLLYYDSGSGKFRADDTWTTSTIVDGLNF